MPVISNNSSSSFPYFVENQILRANDLNQLVEGLLAQLRQNRTYNIGIGIVNGLGANIDSETEALIINSGFGISSDGYTFETNECTLDFVKAANSLDCRKVPGGCDQLNALIDCLDDSYELTSISEEEPEREYIEGWESITGWRPPSTDSAGNTLSQEFCIVLLWCEKIVEEGSCFNDCEQKGADQNAELKVILMPLNKYETIFPPNDPTANSTTVSLEESPLIRRFGYDNMTNCLELCQINNWVEFYNSYRLVCEQAIPTIIAAYTEAFEEFYKKAANTDVNPFEELQDCLSTLLQAYPETSDGSSDNCPEIQYLYSYFQELILAYEAFHSVANGITLIGNSEDSGGSLECLFPKHISLGVLHFGEEANYVDEEQCRSKRQLPDVFPQVLERREKALELFDRMKVLVQKQHVGLPINSQQGNYYLTPDIRRFTYLDSRALPFYYGISAIDNWKVDDQLYPFKNRHKIPYSANNHILLSEVEPYDFYRLEGHIGDNLKSAIDKIEDCKTCLNIAFDVRAVRIGPGTALPPGMEIDTKDLEIAFQNARNGLINQLEDANQHESIQGELEDITKLLDYVYVTFTSLSAVTSPYDNTTPDCCSGNLPTIPEDYLQDFIDLFDDKIYINERPLDPVIGDCIKSLAIEYHERLLSYEQALNFPCFAKKHPGLEHMGGVPRGGTLVLIYKESENREQTVVADFCLPYLCCSEGVIIKNEIRKINNELVIPKVVFCFDTASTSNEPITGTVAPFGGTLTISTPNGDENFPVNINQSDGSFSVNYTSLFGGTSPAFSFSEGEIALVFTYEIGGASPEKRTVTIYKKPVLVCETSVERINKYDEACNYLGYTLANVTFDTPISLEEFDTFTICYQNEDLNPVEFSIKSAGIISPEGAELLNSSGDLAFLNEVPLFVESPDLILKAVKGNCGTTECSIPLPSKCPDAIRFVQLQRTTSDGDEEIIIKDTLRALDLFVEGHTGYFTLLMEPTSLNMSATVSITYADGSVNNYENAQIIIPNYPTNNEQGEINCELDNRYYLIYDQGTALNTLGGDSSLDANFFEMVEGLEPIEWGDWVEYTIELTYTAAGVEAIEACDLPNATLTIINPMLPQPEPDPSEEETTPDTGSSESDTSETTEEDTSDTVEDASETDKISGGTRGISSALLSSSTPMSAEANQLLNQRRAAQMEQMNSIRTEQAAIAKLAGFRHATNLIGMQADEVTLETAYRKALNPLMTSYKKASDKKSKATLEALIIATHHALLDKLSAQETEIQEATRTSISKQMKKTAAAGISLTNVKRNWKAADMRRVFGKDKVNPLYDLIKS